MLARVRVGYGAAPVTIRTALQSRSSRSARVAIASPLFLSATPSHGECVSCHMPRQRTPEVAHTAYTDHRIQIPGSSDSVPARGARTLRAWREPPAALRNRNLGLALYLRWTGPSLCRVDTERICLASAPRCQRCRGVLRARLLFSCRSNGPRTRLSCTEKPPG